MVHLRSTECAIPSSLPSFPCRDCRGTAIREMENAARRDGKFLPQQHVSITLAVVLDDVDRSFPPDTARHAYCRDASVLFDDSRGKRIGLCSGWMSLNRLSIQRAETISLIRKRIPGKRSSGSFPERMSPAFPRRLAISRETRSRRVSDGIVIRRRRRHRLAAAHRIIGRCCRRSSCPISP